LVFSLFQKTRVVLLSPFVSSPHPESLSWAPSELITSRQDSSNLQTLCAVFGWFPVLSNNEFCLFTNLPTTVVGKQQTRLGGYGRTATGHKNTAKIGYSLGREPSRALWLKKPCSSVIRSRFCHIFVFLERRTPFARGNVAGAWVWLLINKQRPFVWIVWPANPPIGQGPIVFSPIEQIFEPRQLHEKTRRPPKGLKRY